METKIKYYRELQGMSQEELAQKATVSRTTISDLETGKGINLKLQTMDKIAVALNESISNIFNL